MALPAGVAEAVPTSFLLPNVSVPCCHTCQPSAAAPRPRPLRCGLSFYQAHRVKVAQEAGQGGAGALVGAKRRALTRCATLGQPHGGSVVKGSKGVDF